MAVLAGKYPQLRESSSSLASHTDTELHNSQDMETT